MSHMVFVFHVRFSFFSPFLVAIGPGSPACASPAVRTRGLARAGKGGGVLSGQKIVGEGSQKAVAFLGRRSPFASSEDNVTAVG